MWHLWPLDDGLQCLKFKKCVFFWGQKFTNFDKGIGKASDFFSSANKVD
jgi:hypothetical protein